MQAFMIDNDFLENRYHDINKVGNNFVEKCCQPSIQRQTRALITLLRFHAANTRVYL